MREIPTVDQLDVAFGSIKHMPKYDTVPEQFKDDRNPYVRITSKWFFSGLPKDALKEKAGVDRDKALAAIKAILGSWEPKHEHKTAAVAYLLSEWFDINPKALEDAA